MMPSRRERRAAWREQRKNMPGALRECRAAEAKAFGAAIARVRASGESLELFGALVDRFTPEHLRLPRPPGQGTHGRRTIEWRKLWAPKFKFEPGGIGPRWLT